MTHLRLPKSFQPGCRSRPSNVFSPAAESPRASEGRPSSREAHWRGSRVVDYPGEQERLSAKSVSELSTPNVGREAPLPRAALEALPRRHSPSLGGEIHPCYE